MNDYKTKDLLGTRMKEYEKHSEHKVCLDQPIVVRIDGKRFSKFTKGMLKPFDHRMAHCMISTTLTLMDNLHANVSYTQSDEITLVFLPKKDTGNVVIPFDGRVQKCVSVFAAMTTANFIRDYDFVEKSVSDMGEGSPFYIEGAKPFVKDVTPYFDCRIFNVPDLGEATNALLWRIIDARKNAISSAYRWNLGHKKMQNLSGKEMVVDMKKEGIDFDVLYTKDQRFGSMFLKSKIMYTDNTKSGDTYQRSTVIRESGEYMIERNFVERMAVFEGTVA